MTKNDAIVKAANADLLEAGTRGCWVSTVKATNFVEMAVALGMLKLDEPKSARARFCEAIRSLPMDSRRVFEIEHVIDADGLKIVEK